MAMTNSTKGSKCLISRSGSPVAPTPQTFLIFKYTMDNGS